LPRAVANQNPRAGLISELALRMSELEAAGDHAAARIAYQALGLLLGEAQGGAGVDVADLATERAKRERSR
jgi:hypothetical protein